MIRKQTAAVICAVSTRDLPEASTVEAALGEGDDQGACGAHGSGLDRREQPAIDAAENQPDQENDGKDLAGDLGQTHERSLLDRWLRPAARIDPVRPENSHQHDPDRKAQGKHDARDDPGNEEIADRAFGQNAVENEQQARRDQHAEHGRAGDDADGEARRIAVPKHLRDGHSREHRRRGNADAGDSREHRIGRNRRNAETAAHAPQQLVCNVERILADIGDRDQQAHQHE
jgi:hypothetical protein